MELIEHRCKRCGGELKKIGEGRWSCPYCACVYDEAVVQKNTRSLHEEFDEAKREIVCNLRRNLYDAVNEEYISSEKVRECAAELKKYLPDDFAACFYEVAVSNNVKQLTKHIRRINVEENYSEIECVIRFLIKSLQTEYLLELNNLVERAYKQRDLVLFEKYSTEISVEAEKVEGGVYETKMPRDVFVAYSSKDMETVSELCEVLEGQGLKCFVAARNLRHGKGSVENYDKLLCEAMDHCKSFVFVSSTNSRSFSCDALTKELPYIQERDIENAPAEHKNNYANMPHSYKKPRVEYRIEESRGFSAPDAISNEFFDGYERVYSPEAVAERVAKQLLSAAEKKAVKKPTPAPAPVIVQSAPAEVGGQRIEPLLKRAVIFIDDGEWEDAEAYCEKALDIDPECAQAYIYKLMIDLRVKKQEELSDCKESFEENGNFKKAVRFGDEETVEMLNGYVSAIRERNETQRKDNIYNLACSLMKDGNIDAYNTAILKFGEIPSWKDSQKKIDECRKAIKQIEERKEAERKDNIYNLACSLMKENTTESYRVAVLKFSQIPNWRDVNEKIEYCRGVIKETEDRIEAERIEAENKKKNDIYRSALILLNSTDSNSKILIQNINTAKNKFAKISGWRDAQEKILECDRRLDEIKKQIEIERLAAKKRRQKAIKISAICSGIVAIVIVFAIVLNTVIIPAIEENQSYNAALSLIDDGKYEEAIEAFEALDGYKDSADRIEECRTKIKDRAYNAALKLMEEGKYDEAIKAFEALGTYKESDKKVEECNTAILDKKYNEAVSLVNNKKYYEAIEIFEALNGYKDSAKKIEECSAAITEIENSDSYDIAIDLMNEGNYPDAIEFFQFIVDYKDSAEKIEECKTALKDIDYNAAVALMNEGKYAEAIVAFEALGDHKDSAAKIEECKTALKDIDYNAAVALMTEGKYAEAIVAFEALGGHKDSATKIEECKTALKDIDYDAAVALMEEGKYAEAIVAFEALGDHKDSAAKIVECKTAIKDIDYNVAVALMNEGKYSEAIVAFEALGDHKDSAAKIEECKTALKDIDYDAAVALMNEGKYAEAIVAFEDLGEYNDTANLLKKCQHFAAYKFTIVSNGYSISNYEGNDVNLEIPRIYKGELIVKIDFSAFENNCDFETVMIPDSVTNISVYTFNNCGRLTSISVDENNKYYKSVDGNLYSKNGQTFIKYATGKAETSFVVPDTVTSIAVNAFYNCTALASVTIPDSVTSIGASSFKGCSSLKNITLPFVGTLKDGTDKKYFGSIFGASAYMYNGGNVPESLKTVTITDCSNIDSYAFYGCTNLVTVSIPKSITRLNFRIFDRCANLESVVFIGSEKEWESVSKYNDWNYCSDSSGLDGRYLPVIFAPECDGVNHQVEIDNAVQPTCTETGLTEGSHCYVCDTVIVAQEIVDALGHDEIQHEAKEPTCAEVGWDVYVTCSRCDFSTYVEIPTNNEHEIIEHEAKEPTCAEIGWDAYVTCSKCCFSTYREIAIDYNKHKYSGSSCVYCGIQYRREGNFLYFGEYPQSLKMPDVVISENVDERGYYLGSDGSYYAKVVADPYNSGYKFSTGEDVIDGEIYYFKVEAIKWRVLCENDGTALIMCDTIIESQKFGNSFNNPTYDSSTIRAWLNEKFYDSAFTQLQKELILVTMVDNSVKSTGVNYNKFACSNTEDKVFVLSYVESTNSSYGFSLSNTSSTDRMLYTTDYYRSIGEINTSTEYYGYSSWLLRSPNPAENAGNVLAISSRGSIINIIHDDYCGVVPALQIRLD